MAVKPTFDEARGWDCFFDNKEAGENLCHKGTRQTSRGLSERKEMCYNAHFSEFHSAKKMIPITR